MNELEHLARLRDEVTLESSRAIEDAVLMEILAPGLRESTSGTRIGRKARIRGVRTVRRRGLRPVIAGALALAVGAGTAIGISVSRSPQEDRGARQVIAWSGRPTAAWPPGQPSYGRASTEAQLIDYATRAAAADRAPRPDEWVVTKVEQADSSGGGGGYLFGQPDQRHIYLQWHRGDGCAGTEALAFPANLAPAKTVTGKLTVSLNPQAVYGGERDCWYDLAGWKSVTYSYLDSLPTDPAALEGVILKNNPPGGFIPTREAAIFDAIHVLLADGGPAGVVVPRKLEAAFYQILQRLPGVHFESDTDLAGRNGLGFWMVVEGYLKEEIVIDPLTYQYMGFKDVAIKDHTDTGLDGIRHIEKGHVLGWEALLGSAIVQRPGQLP
jgi:hypothetical protein